ncbi:MAG TPA: alginate lyase family protein, partial [Pyrinomonadaceae bacterium]|nr:alginate lyase family protein [Pyrinomonadaceae bacterium]
ADWMVNNPPKIGVNWLSSLELAFRSMSWIWSIYFFRTSPVFTPEILLQILKFLYLNARHLETYLSTYYSPNTHLTGEALGLYFIGSFVPEFEDAKRWRDLGYQILLNALDFQVRSDGTYIEQSSHYHRYTTDFYANLMILRELDESNVESKHREKLDHLLDFLMHVQQPNGETTLLGDDDGGRLYQFDERAINDFRPTLALGAALLNRGDLKFLAGQPSADLLWLLGAEGLRRFESIVPVEPRSLSQKFEAGGYFTARSSWREDADQIIIQCGPHGFLNGGHAHADALNFVMSLGGRPVFVDSGTYVYTSNRDARDRYRSSQAHNCLTVNGASSSRMHGPFSWRTLTDGHLSDWKVEGGAVAFRGHHDGFLPLGVRYERTICIAEDSTVSVKETLNSIDTSVFELHFILAPGLDATIDLDSHHVSVVDSSGTKILLIKPKITGENPGRYEWRKEEWSVSPVYGAQVETQKLVFQTEAQGSFEIHCDFVKPGASRRLPYKGPLAA